jgi:uncharacterized protein (DUF302 family)
MEVGRMKTFPGGWRMLVTVAVAFLAGVLVSGLIMVSMVKSRMISVQESSLSFEETVAALEGNIAAAEGWSSPGTRDLNGMMAKHGVTFTPRVKLVEMCKAPYAARVLQHDRKVATLMPCAIAVYEDDDGRVWLSKMNLGLMGKLFGGTVGEVMGDLVAGEEKQILAPLLTQVAGDS